MSTSSYTRQRVHLNVLSLTDAEWYAIDELLGGDERSPSATLQVHREHNIDRLAAALKEEMTHRSEAGRLYRERQSLPFAVITFPTKDDFRDRASQLIDADVRTITVRDEDDDSYFGYTCTVNGERHFGTEGAMPPPGDNHDPDDESQSPDLLAPFSLVTSFIGSREDLDFCSNVRNIMNAHKLACSDLGRQPGNDSSMDAALERLAQERVMATQAFQLRPNAQGDTRTFTISYSGKEEEEFTLASESPPLS